MGASDLAHGVAPHAAGEAAPQRVAHRPRPFLFFGGGGGGRRLGGRWGGGDSGLRVCLGFKGLGVWGLWGLLCSIIK